jgi:hypothetical protein
MRRLEHMLAQAPADALEIEIAQEKAAALGRLGRALERTLAALAAFDADIGGQPAAMPPAADLKRRRARMVAEASLALWYFAVQREACGLRDLRPVLRDYRVPPEVAVRMGTPPPAHPRLLR